MFGLTFEKSQRAQASEVRERAFAELAAKCSAQSQQLQALNRSMAVIEFDPKGIILSANENFLNVVGYQSNEIVGKHHSMFVPSAQRTSAEYASFWRRLQAGESFAGEFPRVGMNGREVWIQATYNPIVDDDGRVTRVVKYASDITQAKKAWATLDSQVQSVNRSFAVIEFTLEGIILNANENFLKTMGYQLHQVVGQHHRMFVESDYARSREYIDFWEAIRRGQYHAGEFRRIGKGGNAVYIQASYNPVFGLNGEITSVVKFATDITAAVNAKQRTCSVSNAVAASVTQMTQTIVEINRNVLSTANLARDAETLAHSTATRVKKLDEGSKTIEKVVEVIRDLAEQTNLLALNATIESARAGDAGRGFAVVASEVKDLAKQTAQATQNIEATVNMIQNSIDEVVNCVNQISGGVSDVSTNMTMISAAVEEQSVTMNSIAGTAEELRQL